VILRHGAIVEMGATAKVFGSPQHAYTRMLLASVPQLHRKWEEVEAELRTGEGTAAERQEAGYARAAAAIEADPVDSTLVEFEHDHFVRRPGARLDQAAAAPAGKAAA
jgi:peptide/nickel transport system ATP-binding protein